MTLFNLMTAVNTGNDVGSTIEGLQTWVTALAIPVATLVIIACGIGKMVPNQKISQFCQDHFWNVAMGAGIVSCATTIVGVIF